MAQDEPIKIYFDSTMATRPAGPIHPRIKDMRLYEAAIRNAYLNPMFDRLGRRLAQAESANQAWAAMDDVVEKMAAQPRFGVPTKEIQRQLGRIEGVPPGPRRRLQPHLESTH